MDYLVERQVPVKTIEELMIELDGADPDTVNRIAWEVGSLPVRLAMLGLASVRKGVNPLWWGYPPGVFIGYKWDGEAMHQLVTSLAAYIRGLGYRAFLDTENLDENADAYFHIPSYITSLQDCAFYVLLLTELSADMIDGRHHKTTWIYDEYQHAVRVTDTGRLFLVPVLLEPKGMIEDLTPDRVIDLTANPSDFGALRAILTPGPITLGQAEISELRSTVEEFDKLLLSERWEDSDRLLRSTAKLEQTFDHLFRRMLLSIYTADEAGLRNATDKLYPVYGEQLVSHIYKGYCSMHEIPNRLSS